MERRLIREQTTPAAGKCPAFTARLYRVDEAVLPYLITIDVASLSKVHDLSSHATIGEAMANFQELVKKAPSLMEGQPC